MAGEPNEDQQAATRAVDAAVGRLLEPMHRPAFGPWEEHLRKHYPEPDRAIVFTVLGSLSTQPTGLHIDSILSSVAQPDLQRARLFDLLTRLHTEGFVTVDPMDQDTAACRFRNPLLRRWWQRYRPTSST